MEALETVVCVGGVVLQGARALLVRQANGHPLQGQWSIPWGILDAGESPDQAVLRETQEEAGVGAKIVGLVGLQNLRRPGWMALVFLCRHADGEPSPDEHETDAARYLSLEEMSSLHEPVEPWCEWLVRRVLQGGLSVIDAEPDNPYQPRSAFFSARCGIGSP
jgi:ADP-ribose pyrophosphatase YjhB (NUDIX family)